jgi:hypothetical protein
LQREALQPAFWVLSLATDIEFSGARLNDFAKQERAIAKIAIALSYFLAYTFIYEN